MSARKPDSAVRTSAAVHAAHHAGGTQPAVHLGMPQAASRSRHQVGWCATSSNAQFGVGVDVAGEWRPHSRPV
jgi:hypothetical protein